MNHPSQHSIRHMPLPIGGPLEPSFFYFHPTVFKMLHVN